MQIGTGSSTVAWEFEGTDFDDEMLGWYRDYTRLHLRIIWTDGEVFTQGAVIEVVGFAAAPKELTLDGAPLAMAADVSALVESPGWVHAGTTLWIGVAAGEHTVGVAR